MKKLLESINRNAGRIIRDNFGKVKTGTSKAEKWDLCTKIDLRVEKIIISTLSKKFPSDGILAEENGEVKRGKNGRRWIIDPLDGTLNFVKGVPFFCTMIALEDEGDIIIGSIYDPIHREWFYSEKGKGSVLNGKPIAVSRKGNLKELFGIIGWVPSKKINTDFNKFRTKLERYTVMTKRLGSAGLHLAYTAAGRVDYYLSGNTNPWDVAAGYAIIKGAGGEITDPRGFPLDWHKSKLDVLAANKKLYRKLYKLINKNK